MNTYQITRKQILEKSPSKLIGELRLAFFREGLRLGGIDNPVGHSSLELFHAEGSEGKRLNELLETNRDAISVRARLGHMTYNKELRRLPDNLGDVGSDGVYAFLNHVLDNLEEYYDFSGNLKGIEHEEDNCVRYDTKEMVLVDLISSFEERKGHDDPLSYYSQNSRVNSDLRYDFLLKMSEFSEEERDVVVRRWINEKLPFYAWEDGDQIWDKEVFEEDIPREESVVNSGPFEEDIPF